MEIGDFDDLVDDASEFKSRDRCSKWIRPVKVCLCDHIGFVHFIVPLMGITQVSWELELIIQYYSDMSIFLCLLCTPFLCVSNKIQIRKESHSSHSNQVFRYHYTGILFNLYLISLARNLKMYLLISGKHK